MRSTEVSAGANQGGASDPNAGMHAVFAFLVALADRQTTGEGAQLEVTMVEGALNAGLRPVFISRDGGAGPDGVPMIETLGGLLPLVSPR